MNGTIAQDLRYAVRSLNRTRGFTLVVLATLSLGIAGSVLVFSVINAALLRPLPYPENEQLVILHWKDSRGHIQNDLPASAFLMIKERSRSLQQVTAVYSTNVGVNLAGGGSTQYVPALQVSASFFRTLRASLLAGRDFLPEEDHSGGPRACIISNGLWERAFSKATSVPGKQVTIDNDSYTIVGIAAADFRSYPEADLWLPLRLNYNNADPGSDYRVLGRMADGYTLPQVRQELNALSDQYDLEHFSKNAPFKGAIIVEGFPEFVKGVNRQSLVLLFGAVLFVLMIACTNIAVLLLVRAADSDRETGIRIALGSSRLRLIQGLMMQSLLLALGSGILGTILAKELIPLVLLIIPPDLALSQQISIDGRVMAVAFAAAIVSSFLFGFLPALRLSHSNSSPISGLARYGGTAGPGQTRLVRLLVIVETALTLILMSGTTLLLEGLVRLHRVSPGFEEQRAYVAQISLAGHRYQRTSDTRQLLDRILQQLSKEGGIETVATVNGLPLEKGLNLAVYPVVAPDRLDHAAEYRIVAGSYFHAMRIPVVAGRDFVDPEPSLPVAIVNETGARRWWPDKSPVGQFVHVGAELGPTFSDMPRLIIGVARDVHERGLDLPPAPTVYVPVEQTPDNITAFVNKFFLTSIIIKTAKRNNVFEEVRNAVSAADPELPVASCRSLKEVADQSLSRSSFVASLTGIFSSFALLLTAMGLYGLLSYQISLRKKEIAIRTTLGATHQEIMRTILGRGMAVIGVSLLPGIAGALLLKKIIESMFYNVRTGSLAALATATALVIVASAAASLLAAIRAASLDPMAVLRSE
ncbi:MAG TPA: ABC transporter permease [Candidatus Dormibacteraeota bacterium]|nr:ABC transporter permease [Candidatus Dormibacteraeota bacterium]